MRVLKTGSLGLVLFLAANANAQDRASHRLTIHLADKATWQSVISNRSTAVPADPMISNGETQQSFRYQIKAEGVGFIISRHELSRTDDRKPSTLLPDVSDVTAGTVDAFRDIDFRADSSLMPQEVVNLSDIDAKQHDYATKTFGKDMADKMVKDEATSASIIADSLWTEALLARVRQADLVVGLPWAEPDTVPSIAGRADAAAQTTITLDSWDLSTGHATYTLTTQIDPDAKTAQLTAFFQSFLYPLNTMDNDQIATWKKKSAELAALADYTNGKKCTLSGDIRTGLILEAHCLVEMHLKSTIFSQSAESEVRVLQVPGT